MTDIFISYAKEDRDIAAAIAGKLSSRGYRIWWDRDLIGGTNFREVIQEQLHNASIILVLWSEHSVLSDWVIQEADEAHRLKKIIPLKIPELNLSRIPLGHRGSQFVDANDFNSIVRSIRSLLGQTDELTPDAAIRRGSLAVGQATTLAWRYSYEYGLHIALCFILVPIVVELLKFLSPIFKTGLPTINIWIQIVIFFGCLGWSRLLASLTGRRSDSGIFLLLLILMLAALLVYLFTPANGDWQTFSNNFQHGTQIFLTLGAAIWAVFFLRNLQKLTKE